MKPRFKSSSAFAYLLSALGAIFPAWTGQASVLTFDITGISSGSNMPGTYGDRIVSANDAANGFSYGTAGGFTPNVTVAYTGLDIFSDANLKWRSSGYSNFSKCVSYVPVTDYNWGVQFQADAGFKVTLTSFDLGKSGTSALMSGVFIQNAAGATVWDSGNVTLSGAGAPGQSFVLPAGITDTRLTIVVRARVVNPDPAPAGTNGTALDNITFSQTSTAPAIAVSKLSNGDVQVAFTGILQTSTNLGTWSDVTPAPASPYVIPKSSLSGKRYFRAKM